MSKLFVFLWMLFDHVFDDYKLQGIMANMKQKIWWKENAPEESYKKYKHDYIAALIMHSISWSFMVMLPIAVYLKFDIDTVFGVVFACNVLIHALVDDLKANKLRINLIQDQAIHIVQIIISFVILVLLNNI